MKKNLWLVECVLSYAMCCASKGLSNRYSVYKLCFQQGMDTWIEFREHCGECQSLGCDSSQAGVSTQISSHQINSAIGFSVYV